MAEVTQGVHAYEPSGYVAPTEPAVREKLSWFQDQKLGFMTHFGAFSLTGMFESWPMSDEDAPWSRRFVDWTDDPARVRRDLFGLKRSFNPLRFQPDKWAALIADCGFRYFLLTTKHHDGFCLFDTKLTDHKTTSAECPYHVSEHADIVGAAFAAMRARGIGIGAYFSKADWHSDDYWHDKAGFTTRNPTYDTKKDPERWARFRRFTQGQLLELAENYGPLDILWLDAGWVNARNGQDIGLADVIPRIREKTPGMLVADRTVGGRFENYITPEQTVPQSPPGVPWESCVSLGSGFSYRYDDAYKQPRQLIHLLIDIVAKGGNLALNLAPQPDGRLPDHGVRSMRALGQWLKINGEGIYGTRAQAPYRAGDFAFTRKGNTVYMFKLYREGEQTPAAVRLPVDLPVRAARLLGYGGVTVNPERGLVIDMPRDMPPDAAPIAHCFACELAE